METPLSEGEKRFVLAEIIKASHIDLGHLLSFIQQTGVKPEWLNMQLPNGRNMNQCMRAWDNMVAGPFLPSTRFSPAKRKSQDDLNDQQPKRPAVWTAPTSPLPLPHPHLNTSQQQALKPSLNGFTHSPISSPTTVLLPRKRGRPSRADMEARTRQRASHSTGYAPIAPVPGPVATPVLEQPKKRGRRSASERILQPAMLPRRALENSPGGTGMVERQPIQNNAPGGENQKVRLIAPAPAPSTNVPISPLPPPPAITSETRKEEKEEKKETVTSSEGSEQPP